MKSSIRHKVLASSINCLIVMILSLPIFLVQGWEAFRISSVTLFFLYNLVFRRRCIGMMVAGTYLTRPASLSYITLYTVSYSTFFWWWQFPFDLLLINGIFGQIPSVIFTGNTLHGFLAGQWTQIACSQSTGRQRKFGAVMR